ncbi:hypothetical protein G9A89_016066 [Geosiphon pyriformis]|nr:hypothetical protein G9A89_016066 [Geosiphon pyriformis]
MCAETEGKITAVVCFTNFVRVLGQLFKHRSHNLQVVSWYPVHLLCFLVHISVNPLNNFLVGVVWCRTFLSGVFSKSMYFRCLFSFCHYEIAFVEQLRCHNGTVFNWKTFKQWKRLDLYGPVPVWFGAAIWDLHNFGSLDVCSSLPNSAVAKNILKSHNVGASSLSVYTDGFFCGLGSVNMKAGTAVFFKDINLGLGVEVTDVMNNVQANLLAGVSSHSSWLLLSPFWFKKYFILANDSIVSDNSRHFVCNVFWSIYRTYWELGSDIKIVDSHLLPNIDWSRLFLVWHLDSHMAAGFMSCHSAGSHFYFMKALHHRLPINIHKHLYDKCYPSVVCLYCGNIEVSDHVFSCAFDATAWLQLFVDFASAWRIVFGLSYTSSLVLQMLSDCLTNLSLVAFLCKDFVLVDWYQKAASCFDDSKTASDKMVEFVCMSGGMSMLLAYVIRLFGIDDAFGVSFGLCSSC